jgi:hypothetical protein
MNRIGHADGRMSGSAFYLLNANQWAYIEQKTPQAAGHAPQVLVNDIYSVRPGCLPVGTKLPGWIGLTSFIDDEVDDE